MLQPHFKDDRDVAQAISQARVKIRSELSKRIIGQSVVIEDLLACLLAGGHCLLVGVPGLAKTTLVRSIAKTLALDFSRIQFTPDLMPSDITGSEILFEDRATGTREFRFVKGPVFANVLLADEINRTPPKTQSALLQAMEEHEVTAAGKTYPLPSPFWVLATQNPIEQEGTYPLPEAQQDRFMFSVELDYPSHAEELEIITKTTSPVTGEIVPVVSAQEVVAFREFLLKVPVAKSIVEAAVTLVRRSRPNDPECSPDIKPLLTWGAGPRAAHFLVLAAKAYAVLDSRPTPDVADLRRAAHQVLRHRLVRSFHAEAENVSVNEIVGKLVGSVLKG